MTHTHQISRAVLQFTRNLDTIPRRCCGGTPPLSNIIATFLTTCSSLKGIVYRQGVFFRTKSYSKEPTKQNTKSYSKFSGIFFVYFVLLVLRPGGGKFDIANSIMGAGFRSRSACCGSFSKCFSCTCCTYGPSSMRRHWRVTASKARTDGSQQTPSTSRF